MSWLPGVSRDSQCRKSSRQASSRVEPFAPARQFTSAPFRAQTAWTANGRSILLDRHLGRTHARCKSMSGVFVSHRLADSSEAERLATELRNRGHSVWLDEWEIGIGDSIIGKMNEGLTTLRYLVLCYSSSGSLSAWMSQEWMSTLARQLGGAGVKILPVRLTGGDPPPILADIKYADLVADWPSGVDALCAAIK